MSVPIPRAIVGALIFNQQQRVFLMRSSGKYGSQWIIPGGKVDFGESINDALKREILEETNLIIGSIKFCGIRELIEPSRHFIFLEHTAIAQNPDDVILNQESTEYGWFSREDISNLDVAKPTLELIDERWSRYDK